ncbi:PREDICTED: UPF0764 protein C16orf89 homolog [Eufriesea mexicana]|uniref:UPF0764 protein C16orf89 homolog n=1 Tax=Eufriesea mexicana TaxID=516756 RepID=UPI00083C7041|nr:PREDICTED: UPF0764 protein C16orf89 homolog [Eufriesea mexicana]
MEILGGVTTVCVVLLVCSFPPWNYGNFVSKDFEDTLLALSKVIEYIHQRPRQMNADVTLSLTIIEANVAAIFVGKNIQWFNNEQRNGLIRILKLCDSTRQFLLEKINSKNENVQLLHETINYPALWMKAISWRRGALERGWVNLELSYQDIRDLVMQGAPKEEESDRCLGEIVRNKLNSNHRFPDLCAEILATRGPTRGYPLTHRLLIVQIAKVLNCDQGVPSSELILSYCSAILQDLIDIEVAGFPYQTRDLMMEQVLLCGMEGFLEFTDEHYARLILGWSHPSGCFSSFGSLSPRNETRVSRRASLQTDFGCDSHTTGLAAASFSLFIRKHLENW